MFFFLRFLLKLLKLNTLIQKLNFPKLNSDNNLQSRQASQTAYTALGITAGSETIAYVPEVSALNFLRSHYVKRVPDHILVTNQKAQRLYMFVEQDRIQAKIIINLKRKH
ncbi:MAG: hypothetical protein ACPGJV_13565 [Bacteriovoracaceae bacterium]